MSVIYDILIIGGGPAGLSAGIYGSRAKLNVAILEKGNPGGQAATTAEMENYPGTFDGATGPGIMQNFAEHARHFGTTFLRGLVTDVDFSGTVKKVFTKSGEIYQAHCVILAPGAEPRTLNIPGEGRLRGKGVSYCATCDADFFEELDVVVVGNGDAAIEEAMYLTRFANEVSVVVIHDEGILDCNKASAEKAFANPKLKFIWNSVLDQIIGDELVEKVVIKSIKTGEYTEKEVNGVFFFVGTVPKTEFLRGKVALDPYNYIITNEKMETNVPGVYAVGDARTTVLRQVVTAAADGAVASVMAEKYLTEMEAFRTQVLDRAEPVLLAFWAPQVEKSIATLSMLENVVAKSSSGAVLSKMDTYRNKKTADAYGVTEIPSVLLFVNGEVKGRINGECTEADVEALVESIRTWKKEGSF